MMKTIFNKKKRVREAYLQRSVRRSIRTFFEGADLNVSILSMGITDVSVKLGKEKIEIVIVLERPGLLIGKGGKTIDALEQHLKDGYQTDVLIGVKESKLWY